MKLLAVDLVAQLAGPLAVVVSDLLGAQATPGVVSHVVRALRSESGPDAREGPGSLGEALLESVAKAASDSVGFVVSETLLRALPACVLSSSVSSSRRVPVPLPPALRRVCCE